MAFEASAAKQYTFPSVIAWYYTNHNNNCKNNYDNINPDMRLIKLPGEYHKPFKGTGLIYRIKAILMGIKSSLYLRLE